MLMVLENDTMNLIDPLGQTLLHAQPIGSIRVWGVGRDNGRSVSAEWKTATSRSQPICPTNTVQLFETKNPSLITGLVLFLTVSNICSQLTEAFLSWKMHYVRFTLENCIFLLVSPSETSGHDLRYDRRCSSCRYPAIILDESAFSDRVSLKWSTPLY